jgi:hypothetical protein
VQYFSFNLEYNYEDKINWDKNENNWTNCFKKH